MKIGSSFFMAVAVLSALALTTGCVTTESQGSGRGAGAKTRGFYKAEHKGKTEVSDEGMVPATEPYEAYEEESTLMGDDMISSSDSDYMGGPAPSATQYGETEIYIVQKGDVLSQLAVDFDTTTASLVEMNGLSNPDVLYVGQELRVPAGRGAAQTTTKPSGSIKKGGTYTIQKGDTLSEIALAAGVTIADLRELNGINGDVIMAGETLDIPAYGSVPSSTKKATKSTSTSSAPKTESVEPAPQDTVAVEPEMTAPVLAPATTEPAGVGSIVVEEVMYPGESLEDKARQYGVSVAEIMRINGITDASQVREGQTIRIPVAE